MKGGLKMRTVLAPENFKDIPRDVMFADWKADPDDVIKVVDQQLRAFDLEVVQYEDGGGDTVMWAIRRTK
jgi:hypothetical protein